MTAKSKGQPLPPRAHPRRTCIGCRQVRGKREIIRLVGTADGGVEIDTTGRRAGRGAYLCLNRDCWSLGLKANRLQYALRMKVNAESLRQLAEYSMTLPGRQ
ncbi:MAG: RNase P modulator RnpM [Dehalococcoidia bacterium]